MACQIGMDELLKLGPHDHQIAREDQAAFAGAFQENGRYLDRIENGRNGLCSPCVARQPHRTASGGDIT
jgi:hypothetical protein